MIEYSANINGIQVHAQYRERAVHEIFLPLLKRLTEMQAEKSGRLLVMLAAPPGAGKTTLLSFLQKLCHENEFLCDLQTIGMDGFHRKQEYLKSHFVQRGDRQIPMVEIKGAPVTFDLEELKEHVKEVASGTVCAWPIYDRLLHNPVENAVTVHSDVILLEGNYLLLDEDGWRDLSTYADYTVSVRAEEEMLRTRLIDRRIKTGVDRKAATRFVDFSDMPNVRLCLEKTLPADTRLYIDSSGDYHIDS